MAVRVQWRRLTDDSHNKMAVASMASTHRRLIQRNPSFVVRFLVGIVLCTLFAVQATTNSNEAARHINSANSKHSSTISRSRIIGIVDVLVLFSFLLSR